MVIPSTPNYTIKKPTPILNAKLAKHYARLIHLSLICLSPLIFVPKMILKVIETFGSMCRCLQFYRYVSFSTIFMFYIVFSKIVDNQFLLTAYFHSSKHVQRLVDMTVHCPGAELKCEEISQYVSWLEDLDAVKRNYFPRLANLSTQNVRPIVIVLNYGHIYLGMMVRFLLFVLSAYFA